MERTVVIKLAAVVILVVFCQVESSQGKCEFPAIFNFGDSNSDTGGFYAAFPSLSLPYGMTFFHKPAGRASDGRLVVDFIGCGRLGANIPFKAESSVHLRMGLVTATGLVILMLFYLVGSSQGKCAFPAIFNFGDSNSDTGGFYAAFPALHRPYGMTFFHKPAGRSSDGRLVIDFLAQAFGLPFLSPYLQSLGSDFRHGANYASDAGTVLQPNTSLYVTGISPFYLAVQFNQMKDFKARALDLLSKGKHYEYLPTTDIFSKALYFLDIGQNDFTSQLGWIGIEGVKKFLPEVASQIGETVKELYKEGARTIFVANLAPIGCFPSFLTELPHNDSDLDAYGCMISYNNAVLYYNNLLKEKLEEVRKVLTDASVVYVDSHAIKLEIYTNPRKHGFIYGTKACCGTGGEYNFNQQLFCSQRVKINGTVVTAPVCSDPSSYVSWDGIHNTEAANLYIAKEILSGKYFQPQFPLNTLCDLQPIG